MSNRFTCMRNIWISFWYQILHLKNKETENQIYLAKWLTTGTYEKVCSVHNPAIKFLGYKQLVYKIQLYFKGALNNIENFDFDWISFTMYKVIASKQIQKEKLKNSFREWRCHHFFVKYAQTGDEAN